MKPPNPRLELALGAWLLLVLGIASAGCSRAPEGPDQAAPDAVAVTFYPLEYVTRRLLDQDLPVHAPLPEGEDPIFWQPTDEALRAFQTARLVLSNGAEFEKWLDTASLSQSRLVRAADGFKERFVHFAPVTHSHGAGAHTHVGVDGHTWLDPLNLLQEARAIATALTEPARGWPELKAPIGARLQALENDLKTLGAAFEALVPRLAGVRLIATHPAYNYLAARYGLSFSDAPIDPDAPLDPAGREALKKVRGQGPALLWFEGEPDPALLRAVEGEFGLVGLVFSPAENPSLAERAAGQDYLAIQRANLERLSKALDSLGR